MNQPATTTSAEPSPGAVLQYAGPSTRRRPLPRVLFWALWGACGAAVLLFVISFLMPGPCCRAREPANRIKCSSNLRQIGVGVMTYANENKGRFPDTLQQLLLTQGMTPNEFLCPSSQDERAMGDTPAEQAANLAKPGHCSYVYVGKGLKNGAGRNVVVAYEPPANHNGEGMNVLFADGRAEWVPAKDARQIIQQAERGTRPVVWPPPR